MHPKTKTRPTPYAVVKWITRLLANEQSCVWSAWFRAHHQAAPRPDDREFDFTQWQIEHGGMLRPIAKKYTTNGYKVSTEEQNQFRLKGNLGTLAGKPDLVAFDEEQNEAVVIDAKTGKERESDKIQVMVYMWALPKVMPKFKDVPIYGQVIYTNRAIDISPSEITPGFKKNLTDLLCEVLGSEPPVKTAAYSECRWCPITSEDCPDRIDVNDLFEAETSDF